ncbi:MAG: hypothetical protein F6K28_42840 [Microcoleus sp. SIO2G3]|nr:hypothetical protein [Microcoleus sp. SIO2G3]
MTRNLTPSHISARCSRLDRPSQPLAGWYLPTALFALGGGRVRFLMHEHTIGAIASLQNGIALRSEAKDNDRSTQSGRCRTPAPI